MLRATDHTTPASEPRSQKQAALFALFVLALVGLYAFVARVLFLGFPMSGDEYSYWLQAEIFAHGRLSFPGPSEPELFPLHHVVIDSTIRSKYPPGTSLLLALGALGRVPWLVNPLAGGATVGLVWSILRRLHSDRAAWIGALMLGVGPMFICNAASYYSHVPSLLALTLCLYATLRVLERGSFLWSLLAGLSLGFGVLVRPLDAAVFSVAVTWLLIRHPRPLVALGLSAAAVASLLLPYQQAQYGSPWRSGYSAFDPLQAELLGAHASRPALGLHNFWSLEDQWHHIQWYLDLSTWTFPFAIVLAVVGFAARSPMPNDGGAREHWPRIRVALLMWLGALVAVSLFTIADRADTYGPRYLMPALLPLSLAGAMGWLTLERRLPEAMAGRASIVVLATLALVSALAMGSQLDPLLVELRHRKALYDTVAKAELGRAVVIVEPLGSPSYFTRNGLFAGHVLFAAPLRGGAAAVQRAYPGLPTYVAREGADRRGWHLIRLPPPESR